jgi:hypothetical protein
LPTAVYCCNTAPAGAVGAMSAPLLPKACSSTHPPRAPAQDAAFEAYLEVKTYPGAAKECTYGGLKARPPLMAGAGLPTLARGKLPGSCSGVGWGQGWRGGAAAACQPLQYTMMSHLLTPALLMLLAACCGGRLQRAQRGGGVGGAGSATSCCRGCAALQGQRAVQAA